MCPTHLRLNFEKYLQKVWKEEQDRIQRTFPGSKTAVIEAAANAYFEELKARLIARNPGC